MLVRVDRPYGPGCASGRSYNPVRGERTDDNRRGEFPPMKRPRAELFHIAERAAWEAASRLGEYRLSTRDATLDDVGFIHCSLRHQLRGVAEAIYGDSHDLVVLVIDSARLAVPVRYEAATPGAEAFPHVYGALPVNAVTDVITVGRDTAGRLVLPE